MHGHGDRRFHVEQLHKLDSPERAARQPAAPLVQVIAARHPGVVLDVGAGAGYFALPLAQALPEAVILAADVQEPMLEHLRQRAEALGVAARIRALHLPEGAEGALPVEPGSVDVVLMVNLYHELDDRPAALRQVRAALALGGALVICDWDPDASGGMGPPGEHRVAAAVAAAELVAAGFAPPQRLPLYEDQYTWIARRSAER